MNINNKTFLKNSLLLFIFILSITHCQEITDIQIGETKKGQIVLDEGHSYYKLTIPENITDQILIISTREDNEEYKKSDEKFSDPDFYISKINKYPSSPSSSEWYSEQYGSDLISIPADSIKPNDIFYIGMYCQYKCRYFLKVAVGTETTVTLNKPTFLKIKPHETMNYKIEMKQDYEELKVIVSSRVSGKFRIFMEKKSPSASRTFKVIPSWNNGYVIVVKKGTNEYCTNCDYHVVIQNESEKESNYILFLAKIQDKFYDLRKNIPVMDVLTKNSYRCFRFNMTDTEKKNEKLIIQSTIYSGDATLLLEGWESKNILTKADADSNQYSYQIYLEKYILIDKDILNNFNSEKPYYENRDSVLHFCVYSKKAISYTLRAYYLTQLEKFRAKNILMPGNKITGYLLKNQVMKYELTSYNLDKAQYNIETNITITKSSIAGQTNLYAYFCKQENCIIRKNNIETLNNEQKLINSDKESETLSTLTINHDQNECMKTPKIQLFNGNTIYCQTYILVTCEEPNEVNDLCIFDIRSTVTDSPVLMTAKETYKSSVRIGKDDNYEIVINDEDINSLVVVLNSESGDAQLVVYKSENPTADTEYKQLMGTSSHNDYIPDVVRITAQQLGRQNLIGKYVARVFAATPSTYKIFYYVTYKKESYEKENIFPEVTMGLVIGEIIMDYFPKDIRYKIFSLVPFIGRKDTLKVFVNKVNLDFKIFVYNDISKFKIAQKSDLRRNPRMEEFSGYQWSSGQGSEVIIKTNDENFKFGKTLYVVITPNPTKESKEAYKHMSIEELINEKSVAKFYIGATATNVAMRVKEGLPFTMTLNSDYDKQLYHHYFREVNSGLDLVLNVYLGEVDIFADLKYIDYSAIENLNIENANYDEQTNTYTYNSMKFKLNIKSHAILNFDLNFIKDHSLKNRYYRGANVFYYVRRSKMSTLHNRICQYLLLEKTSEEQAQILQPGVVFTSKIKEGRHEHFIIEEIKKRDGATINVIFKKGTGNVYVRIPEIPETNIRFPSESNNDYAGEFVYSGRIINIPAEKFEQLNANNIKMQILVTVVAESGSTEGEAVRVRNDTADVLDGVTSQDKEKEMEYSITYSNEPKQINQNVPYDGYLSKGQIQYFTFFFDDTAENIYIGLSNMNGDADMYMNKGFVLPNLSNFTWSSNQRNHEYIDIDINDNYFKEHKNEKLSGYYSLALIGFMNTSFSLFVSSHKEKIFPLRNNQPMTCWCEKEGEKCLFRYNDVFQFDDTMEIDENQIIFSSQYLYGSGTMYAKIVKDADLYSENFVNKFPNAQNYDISNKETNQRNYIKISVTGEKYQKDAIVLLTFECREKTKVDITSTSQRHSSSVEYLRENFENIFYLGETKNFDYTKLTMVVNNYLPEKDLIYTVHSYVGSAHFKVYLNQTKWDINAQKNTYNYKLLKEFDLFSSNDEFEYSIDVYNPYSEEYHNYVSKKDKENFEEIFFRVEPKEEFGFYITCNFDKNYNLLPIGKSQNFYVVNNELFGYFDIAEQYKDIEFSLSVEKNLKYYAEVFIKINIIDTTKKQLLKSDDKNLNEFNLYHYLFPNFDNYDYFAATDKTLGKLSLNINNLPKLTDKEKKTKFIRGLFFVRVGVLSTYVENKNDENESEQKPLITLLLTPGVANIKYVEAKPFEYYFSNLTISYKDTDEPETKIYSLTKANVNHDIMVIEINRCNYGGYQILLTDELITKDMKDVKQIKYEENRTRGKHTITVYNLENKHYYLSIKAKMNDFLCRTIGRSRNKDTKCANSLSYLFYYYTTYLENALFLDSEKVITHRPYGKGKTRIDLPLIIKKDIGTQNKLISDFKFDVIATKNVEYLEQLENICFLSKVANNEKSEEDVIKIDNMRVENESALIIENLEYRKKYYINILVQNTKTKELITFQPLAIITGGYLPFPIWRTFLIIFIAIILSAALFIYIVKYRRAQSELAYYGVDSLPKKEIEMRGFNSGGGYERIRYSGLGDSY